MAEFTEVLRQWKRMCKSCETCALCPFEYQCGVASRRSPDDYERIIMNWAAEHPESGYPSWKEWLFDQGIIVKYEGSTCVDLDAAGKDIPADIAEKLGLKPKHE